MDWAGDVWVRVTWKEKKKSDIGLSDMLAYLLKKTTYTRTNCLMSTSAVY